MTRIHQQNWVIRLASFAVFAAWFGVSTRAHADLFVNFSNPTVFSDNINPVSGVLEVSLSLTGTPPMVSSFNLDFSTDGTGLTFSAPEPAMVMPLFSGDTFTDFSESSTNVRVLYDIDGSVAAFDHAGLIKVLFTVAPGHVGTTYNLTWNPTFTQIGDSMGMALPVTLEEGSITVVGASVPEAPAWQSLLLVAIVCAAATTIAIRSKSRSFLRSRRCMVS